MTLWQQEARAQSELAWCGLRSRPFYHEMFGEYLAIQMETGMMAELKNYGGCLPDGAIMFDVSMVERRCMIWTLMYVRR